MTFTESKETGEHLYINLARHFGAKVLFYSSAGGLHDGVEKSMPLARDLIKENYDPKNKLKKDDLRILITTDILAEGVNLHRSNIVINYDLPWNPTRVLQRVGRVNRVGTEHFTVHVFNFFPTAQSDMHLGLEACIKAKIQAFHDALGEDAKYLTEEEEVSTHELFGDRLYKKLNDKHSLQSEDEEQRSELEYLQTVRSIRDNDPSLFEKIKRLPKKARSGREVNASEQVITFFRKGKLKKFCLADAQGSREVTFFDAAALFACAANTLKIPVPKNFYALLEHNKTEFYHLTSGEVTEKISHAGKSNENYIIKRLKTNEMKQCEKFTEEDEEFLKALLLSFEAGIIPKNTSKRIKDDIEREANPLKVLSILKKNVPSNILSRGGGAHVPEAYTREVILSEYLIKRKG